MSRQLNGGAPHSAAVIGGFETVELATDPHHKDRKKLISGMTDDGSSGGSGLKAISY